MNTFYVNKSQFNENKVYIDGDDYHHIKNVLRIKQNEMVYVCDNDAQKYDAKLIEYKDNRAIFEVQKSNSKPSELNCRVTLYQGIPKFDKMDYIIQKTTELGVNTIVPVDMQYSIAKIKANSDNKISRWNKIAKEASSQSRKANCTYCFRAY
jgi:16S rRNA (uracil1498-N3)-methyltransferase